MPKVVMPIADTDSTVSRLVAQDIVQQLMFHTDISDIKDIIFLQRGGIAAQSQEHAANQALKLDVDDYLIVEYSESDETIQYDYSKYQLEFAPIFRASALGIEVTPIYAKTNIELNITIRSKSYVKLLKWLNEYKRNYQRITPTNYHDVQYNYTLPEHLVAYLNQVYQLQENIAGYGETLKQFIEKHFMIDGLAIRQNLNDAHKALIVNAKNTGCLGQFTEIPSDAIETSHEPPISEIKFTYSVGYDRITAVSLQYQKYIHNQVIDLKFVEEYYDRRPHFNPHAGNRTASQTVNVLTENVNNSQSWPEIYAYTGDGWVPPIIEKSFEYSVVLPIQLDLLNLANILDLDTLAIFGFPEWLINLMKMYRLDLCTQFEFAIYLDFFEVNAKTVRIPISVDSNFMIKTNLVLNPRNRYYLRLSVCTNLFGVNFEPLYNDPTILQTLLQWINPDVQLKTIGNGTRVNTDSLFEALNLINRSNYTKPRWPLVLQTEIIATRKRSM